MKSSITISLVLLLLPIMAWSQANTQTVKGTIIDQQSEIPLIGATIEWISTDNPAGVTTDVDGRFSLSGVAIGRQVFRISYLGYNTITLPNINITAGKEVLLNVSMEESVIEMAEVVVTAEVEKDRANNELATVSARNFSLEEVNRYAGGLNDVSRLVTNFAGVSTSNDSRNDIVIRGNSPTGLLWRLEGVPIPNPNHFSTLGTTGGPVSALNPNLLSNSDFMTGAFPAEYGNALSGVFDIEFRSGNRDLYEFTFQLAAFSGLEALVEGPLGPKKEGSFVVGFRNSFVEIADQLGIPIGTNATPNYRDLSFNVDFGKSKLGKFSLFGILATSDIDFLGDEIDETDLFADPNQDAFVVSRTAVVGLRHNIILNDKTYLRTVISSSYNGNTYSEDRDMDGLENKLTTFELDDATTRFAVSSYLNRKFNAKFTLRTGILVENF